LLAAYCEVAGEVGEPVLAGVLVEAALLGVEDGKAAADHEPAGHWCCWWRFHVRGLPGAPPIREIPIDEVTCVDGSISSAVRATRMGNAGEAPAGGLRPANGRIWLYRNGWRAAGIIGSLRDCHTFLLA
jgi:hypothetical protein